MGRAFEGAPRLTRLHVERFFAELVALLEAKSDEAAIGALCERYGLSFDHSWVPAIEERFGPLRMV